MEIRLRFIGLAFAVHCQEFGLWAWPLEASHYGRPKAPIPIFIAYLLLIFLDSQQSLAIQFHGL